MERETKLYESYSIYRSVLWKYMQKKEGFLQSTAFNARERRDFVKIGRRLLLASPFVDRQEFRSCYQQKNFFWNLCGPKAQSGKKYSWILRSLIIRKSKNRRTSLQLADLSSYFWSSYFTKKKTGRNISQPIFLVINNLFHNKNPNLRQCEKRSPIWNDASPLFGTKELSRIPFIVIFFRLLYFSSLEKNEILWVTDIYIFNIFLAKNGVVTGQQDLPMVYTIWTTKLARKTTFDWRILPEVKYFPRRSGSSTSIWNTFHHRPRQVLSLCSYSKWYQVSGIGGYLDLAVYILQSLGYSNCLESFILLSIVSWFLSMILIGLCLLHWIDFFIYLFHFHTCSVVSWHKNKFGWKEITNVLFSFHHLFFPELELMVVRTRDL